jgi:ComF family protein
MLGWLAPPLCVACGADAGRAAPLCRECRARVHASAPSSSELCWAAFAYDGPAGALVRALKFGGRTGVAELMAAQIAARIPPELLAGVVVPVPVHRAHRRRRGIDHAAALARALARRARLDCTDCLARAGDPRPQVGRGRRERIRGPVGTIELRGQPPPRIVLVDDVVTTGATIRACIGALQTGGAEQITAVAYARTAAR